jgi:16S rRNA (cytidine1402-2'-O)-methyltransferase
MQKGKLHLIPNMIADDVILQSFPPHNLEILKTIHYFLAEDIRTARRFLSVLDLGINIRELTFEKMDKHTKVQALESFLAHLSQGNDIGVLSESGCPGIADPGNVAVQWAHQEGVKVVPYVGPSSIFLALMASGLNGQNFCFQGYLPVKDVERTPRLKEIETHSAKNHQTQIFIETPYRNASLWKALLQNLAPKTRLCLAYDVMGKEEYIRTLTVADWKKQALELDKMPALFLFQA